MRLFGFKIDFFTTILNHFRMKLKSISMKWEKRLILQQKMRVCNDITYYVCIFCNTENQICREPKVHMEWSGCRIFFNSVDLSIIFK